MELYKGRTIEKGQVVEVYRNLHTGGFSIRCAKTKLVLAHSENVILKNVKFVVSQAGREKVIQTKHKFVHAFLRGEYVGFNWIIKPLEKKVPIYYNPYKTETFIKATSTEPIYETDGKVLAEDKKVYLLN